MATLQGIYASLFSPTTPASRRRSTGRLKFTKCQITARLDSGPPLVGVEIVLHQDDLRRVRKMHVRQILQRMGMTRI